MIDLRPIREERKKEYCIQCPNNFRFARIYFKRGGKFTDFSKMVRNFQANFFALRSGKIFTFFPIEFPPILVHF